MLELIGLVMVGVMGVTGTGVNSMDQYLQYAQYNGWFTLNAREGKISFSSNLIGRLIVLEYISDGLAYDLDSQVPKLAEACNLCLYKSRYISY